MRRANFRIRLMIGMQFAFGIKPRCVTITTCGCCGSMNIRLFPELEEQEIDSQKSICTSKCQCLDCGAMGMSKEIWRS